MGSAQKEHSREPCKRNFMGKARRNFMGTVHQEYSWVQIRRNIHEKRGGTIMGIVQKKHNRNSVGRKFMDTMQEEHSLEECKSIPGNKGNGGGGTASQERCWRIFMGTCRRIVHGNSQEELSRERNKKKHSQCIKKIFGNSAAVTFMGTFLRTMAYA